MGKVLKNCFFNIFGAFFKLKKSKTIVTGDDGLTALIVATKIQNIIEKK